MASEKTTALTVKKPFYFPLQSGRYEVKPGLFRFSHDFGNGQTDQMVFQFDQLFPEYRAVKLAAREERLEKYYCSSNLDGASQDQVNRFIIQQLCQQAPEHFELEQRACLFHLNCKLTNEILILDKDYQLLEAQGSQSRVNYLDTFDALANQVQEDMAIIQMRREGADVISGLHLCFPNHWSAEDKIGRSFIEAHAPVPDMGNINQHANKLIHSLIYKGPFVRFAWGIATETQLNHHPVAPAGIPQESWHGRSFNVEKPELYLRVERQTLHGMPQVHSALFTIRSYFYDIATVATNPGYKAQLIAALESMSRDDLHYKGLLADKAAILDWLNHLA